MSAVASATPAMKPTARVDAPRVVTRKTGRRLWISSDDASIRSETKPSVQTPAGMLFHAGRAFATRAPGCSAAEVESGREVARPRPYAWQRFQFEAARDEFRDRRRIVRRVIDVAPARERRDDDRGDPGAGTPAVALGRRDMVPEAAVFIVGHDDSHPAPLRTATEMIQQIGNVQVAAHDVGVARVLGESSRGLVESDLGQRTAIDGGDEIGPVAQMLRAAGRAGGEVREIIERLVMRLEIRTAGGPVVDDRPLRRRLLAAVGQGRVPRARVPRPGDILRRERIAYR